MNLFIVLSPFLAAFIYFVAVYRKSHSLLSALVSTIVIGVASMMLVPQALLVIGSLIMPMAGVYVMMIGYPIVAAVIFMLAYRFRVLWTVSPNQAQNASPRTGRFSTIGTVLMVIGILIFVAPFVIGGTTGYALANPYFLTATLVPIGLITTLLGYYLRMR